MVDALEAEVHRIEAEPGVLADWSLPGELPDAAALDVARTVCRRAERLATGLMEAAVITNPSILAYLNRLSDLLWLLGRLLEAQGCGFLVTFQGPARSAMVEGLVMSMSGTRTNSGVFSDAERKAVYRAIFERRDVRSQFLPDRIPDPVLGRILQAAHHAPSVGFMQPWDFILISDADLRRVIRENFVDANRLAAEQYGGEQRALYDHLKLEGMLEAPVNLCVTCDHSRSLGSGLGRHSVPETDLYSTVCAVQNLWLAARAESLGVGWVRPSMVSGLALCSACSSNPRNN